MNHTLHTCFDFHYRVSYPSACWCCVPYSIVRFRPLSLFCCLVWSARMFIHLFKMHWANKQTNKQTHSYIIFNAISLFSVHPICVRALRLLQKNHFYFVKWFIQNTKSIISLISNWNWRGKNGTVCFFFFSLKFPLQRWCFVLFWNATPMKFINGHSATAINE